ncbi:MAG: hypothetical protein IJU19_02925 [Bacteroidales bacterium]|nr:hypothetical protein [Bacteroidales bacterium]
MARQENGINGGYRGSVGTVTGYQWRGIWCLRARQQRISNPQTALQQGHRAAFRERVQLASRFGRVAYKGFHKVVEQRGMTEQNYFIKCNRAAFSEVEGSLAVDWRQLKVGEGPVAPVGFAAAQTEGTEGVVSVGFEKNPTHGRASGDDDVYLYAYCPGAGWGVLSQPVQRRSGRVSLTLPDEWSGQSVHLYGLVCDYAGRSSESAYIEWNEADSGPEAEIAEVAEGGLLGASAVGSGVADEAEGINAQVEPTARPPIGGGGGL